MTKPRGIMTKPPETRIGPAAAVKRGGRLLAPARYRHPGDVICLIVAGLVIAGAAAVTAFTHGTYAGASAVAVTAVAPWALAGRVHKPSDNQADNIARMPV